MAGNQFNESRPSFCLFKNQDRFEVLSIRPFPTFMEALPSLVTSMRKPTYKIK